MSLQNPLSSSHDTPSLPTSTPRLLMGLAEILQICCQGRRNGQIAFTSQNSIGYILIHQGQIVHAVCGDFQGEEAIYYMLTWAPGTYDFNEDIRISSKTVHMDWELLLFEGARRADEGLIPPQVPTMTLAPSEMTISDGQKMQPRLQIFIPDVEPFNFDLVDELTYLGRAEDNDICIPVAAVSGHHCQFVLNGSEVELKDLNSSNGTTVNGETIYERVLLTGDVIHIGTAEIRYELAIVPKQMPAIAATKGLDVPNAAPVPTVVSSSSVAENARPAEPVLDPTLNSIKQLRGSLQSINKQPMQPQKTDTLKLPRASKRPTLSLEEIESRQTAEEAIAKLSASSKAHTRASEKKTNNEELKPKTIVAPPSGAISFGTLAPVKPKPEKKPMQLIIFALAILFIIGVVSVYYFYFLKQ